MKVGRPKLSSASTNQREERRIIGSVEDHLPGGGGKSLNMHTSPAQCPLCLIPDLDRGLIPVPHVTNEVEGESVDGWPVMCTHCP